MAREQSIPVVTEPAKALDRLCGHPSHQGIVAIGGQKKYAELHDVLAALKQDALLVLLDQVEDPHNLGALIRTAFCAGADALIVPERHSAGLTNAVAKTAAGALEFLPIVRVANLVEAIRAIKAKGLWVLGLDPNAPKLWNEVDGTVPLAVVLGSEGRGMRRLVREQCDFLVSLPVREAVDSLNVSVSAGIMLYEILRQRRVSDRVGAKG